MFEFQIDKLNCQSVKINSQFYNDNKVYAIWINMEIVNIFILWFIYQNVFEISF